MNEISIVTWFFDIGRKDWKGLKEIIQPMLIILSFGQN